ncbi:hypothetical protein MKEN_01422300 [Mycena kentingensis (nom. inval.)]|nr:hypothetical protein MKEN_01422300 [Mycena kentingensis (nom. inval.)]
MPPTQGHKPGFDVPLELCILIAHFSTRRSLARLARVSRRLHAIFSPLLHEHLRYPPLSRAETLGYLRSYCDTSTGRMIPHPASLVKELALSDVKRSDRWKDITKLEEALNALPLRHPGALFSPLRVLHWNIDCKLDVLCSLLGDPGSFPSLKELFVICVDANEATSFSFMHKRDLEAFGLDIYFDLASAMDADVATEVMYRLTEALRTLPTTSPSLQTLQLKIMIEHWDDFPLIQPYSDLDAALRTLCFNTLHTLSLCFDFFNTEDTTQKVSVDLAPLLQNHLRLSALTLDVYGTQLSSAMTWLHRLHSFSGTFSNAAALLSIAVHLQELTLHFIHDDHWTLPSFDAPPVPKHSGVSKLVVEAFDLYRSPLKAPNQLTPEALTGIVASFPNLVHLDIVVNQDITNYREILLGLVHLRTLRMQTYIAQKIRKHEELSNAFPASDYLADIQTLVPTLKKLEDVRIKLLVDDFVPMDCGCDGCNECSVWIEMMGSPAQYCVVYRFGVGRGGVLLLSKVCRRYGEEGYNNEDGM